jgi:hypothetical protein
MFLAANKLRLTKVTVFFFLRINLNLGLTRSGLLSKSGLESGPFSKAGPRHGYRYGSATCTHEVLSLLSALFFLHPSIRPVVRKEAETVRFNLFDLL